MSEAPNLVNPAGHVRAIFGAFDTSYIDASPVYSYLMRW
jgi:hypothetical protein